MTDTQTYVAATDLPVSIEEAFAYHERPGALARLTPPWESVEIESSDGTLEVGSRVVLKTRIAGIPVRWVAEHTQYDPPHGFADTQISGPFASWDHRHEFETTGALSTLRDSIEYRLPFGPVGHVLGKAKARKTLEAMFAYRHRLTRDDLALVAGYPTQPMQVAVSGSNGLVGKQLSALLTLLGDHPRPITRLASEDPEAIAAWSSQSEAARLAEVQAVVHLAGKPIADRRWSDEVKREIRDSRVIKTRQLCESLAKLPAQPKVLICASAIGIYGDRGDEILTEDSDPAADFLARVAMEWEEACRPAVEAGIRVVHARFGIILSPSGGALEKTLLPAKFGLGGSLGSGDQWWSWIALDDVIGAIYHLLHHSEVAGPVNFVSPRPVTNREFSRTLARVLHRPVQLPVPAIALRLALGEMADALLLSSTRVQPARLQQAGYRFRFTELEEYLRYCLGRGVTASD